MLLRGPDFPFLVLSPFVSFAFFLKICLIVVLKRFYGESAGKTMSQITRILEAVKNGDHEAAKQLLPLTYQELRRIAGQMLANERDGHTLQPTALIHEAYLRLVGPDGEQPNWDCRAQFFTAAAEAMRWILIDHARRKVDDEARR